MIFRTVPWSRKDEEVESPYTWCSKRGQYSITLESVEIGIAYLPDAFLVDNDPRKLCILSVLRLDTFNLGQDLLLSPLLPLADSLTGPAAPSRKGLVDDLVTLLFDGLELVLLELLDYLISSERSLHKIIILE